MLGFLNLGTTDTSGWTILCCAAVLRTAGCLAASLASTHLMPVVPFSPQIVISKNTSWGCKVSHR